MTLERKAITPERLEWLRIKREAGASERRRIIADRAACEAKREARPR